MILKQVPVCIYLTSKISVTEKNPYIKARSCLAFFHKEKLTKGAKQCVLMSICLFKKKSQPCPSDAKSKSSDFGLSREVSY